MPNPDVIIIGSGPAGSAAAITCAERGLRVVLLEGESFPRHRPGETLHPGIEPLLQQLGVMERIQQALFLRHAGNWVQWEGERHFVPFGSDESGPWLGFQAWRSDFDAILLEKAIALGVEVRQPSRALQPIVQANRVVGVVTSDGEIHAPYLVDSTGRGQWLARKLKMRIDKYSPRLIARFGYAQGDCPVRDEVPVIVADERGWTWTARVRPQVYQWTRLSFVDETIESEWLPEEFQGLTPLIKTSGAEMTWRMVAEPAGPGYFLTGDAAAVLDPASSRGVIKAVMTGRMAGYLIAEIQQKRLGEEQAVCGYHRWFRDWFEHDVEELRKLYDRLPGFRMVD